MLYFVVGAIQVMQYPWYGGGAGGLKVKRLEEKTFGSESKNYNIYEYIY